MRRRRYRAWDQRLRKMVRVRGFDIAGRDIVIDNEKSEHPSTTHYHNFEKEPLMNRFILMDDIGLLDKNKVPIFEGDILDISSAWWDAAGPAGQNGPIVEVAWDETLTGFAPFVHYDCDCGVYIGANECRIIGNIYENLDLCSLMKSDDPDRMMKFLESLKGDDSDG